MTLNDMWKGYEEAVASVETSKDKKQLKRAFFAGAGSFLRLQNDLILEHKVTKNQDILVVESQSLIQEIKDFSDTVITGRD